MRLLLPLAALALLAPLAAAADLLPTEAALGAREARLVVRSATGEVRVSADPEVLVASAQEGEFAQTPRTLRPHAPWRGMDGVVELVLRREDPRAAVDVVVEDGSATGIWVEWPASPGGRDVPAPAPLAAIAATAALARPRFVWQRLSPAAGSKEGGAGHPQHDGPHRPRDPSPPPGPHPRRGARGAPPRR